MTFNVSFQVQYPNSIKLKVAKISSSNSGHQQRCGVFAMETVEPNKVIVEFTGEVIRLDVARVREEKYWKLGFGVPPNIFKFDDEYVSTTGYTRMQQII